MIGAGWVATARHLPCFKRDERAEIIALFDPQEAKAVETARRFKIPSAVSELDELLDLPMDAVVVCTPPHKHAAIVGQALQAGKHVLIEKPMTLTSEEGRMIEREALERGRYVVPAHNFLQARATRRADALLASGRAGAVHSAIGVQLSSWHRRLPTWFDELPGGLFFDEAPHLIYLMRHYLGELQVEGAWRSSQKLGQSLQPVERTEARLSGQSGSGSLLMWTGAPVSEWYLLLLCSKRLLAIDLFRDILIDLPPERAHNTRDVLGTSLRSTVQFWIGTAASGLRFGRGKLYYGHDVLVQRFLDAIVDGAPPPSTARDGWKVVNTIEQVLAQSSR